MIFESLSDEAMGTIRAKWYELLLARWLGDECSATDNGAKVVAYRWRGKLYVKSVEFSGDSDAT